MGTIALYMRLSSEDANEGESSSIQNQRELLHRFVESQSEFSESSVLEFCDDGFSGMNFNRPGVRQMLDLAGSVIHCIIVKDISRFGRNLIEVGNYLDQIFPFLNVRFIAVNEGYDSKRELGRSLGLDLSLKAMVYEMYSRDISEKVCCVQQTKLAHGEYLGNTPFYGYKKSPTKKNKLEVDKPAAEVIRRIFHMAENGTCARDIAIALNQDNIPTPLVYRQINHTEKGRSWKVAGNSLYWTRENVKRVITDERYTGCLISRKRERIDVSVNQSKPLPPKEWIVAENAHEAIVSKETFEQAQGIFRHNQRSHPPKKPFQLFRGIVKCNYCGRTLTRSECKQPFFYCTSKRTLPGTPCTDIQLSEQLLQKNILMAIQERIPLMQTKKENQVQQKNNRQKTILKCQTAINHYKALQTTVFEDYAEGRISSQEYLSRKQSALSKLETEKEHLAKLLASDTKYTQHSNCSANTIKSAALPDKLTRELLEQWIQEIRVSGKDNLEIIWISQE